VYANLPWFLGPYYAIATVLGAELIGQPLPADFRSRLTDLFQLSLFQAQFWRDLVVLMRPLFWPYVVGSTLGSLLLAAAAYQLALAFVNSRRRIRHMMHHRKP
jgi:uncharacterized membrane protein YdfJ with MMPL/SSD domain